MAGAEWHYLYIAPAAGLIITDNLRRELTSSRSSKLFSRRVLPHTLSRMPFKLIITHIMSNNTIQVVINLIVLTMGARLKPSEPLLIVKKILFLFTMKVFKQNLGYLPIVALRP